MTTARRANPPDRDQTAATRILRELKNAEDRAERKVKRDTQRQHRQTWKIFDEETRNLVERCALCGMASVPYAGATRLTAVEWAGAWARGHLSLSFCGFCSKLYRTYSGGREAEAFALSKSLERFDMARYYPSPARDEAASIRANNRRARHGLSWAGAAHRARIGGLADPGDPEKGYSWLDGIEADVVDFSPLEPEPKVSRRLPGA